MGCGTSVNDNQVNQPNSTSSDPKITGVKQQTLGEINHNKENSMKKKQNVAHSLKEVKTEKSIVYHPEGINGEHDKIQMDAGQQSFKRVAMDKVLLFGECSMERKIVHFNPMGPTPSFQILLSRTNNPPPMKYQPPQIILEQSQELGSSYMYSSNSHPPYNFMFATFVDSDCSDSSINNKHSSVGLIFLCGGVNFDFDYLSDQAFLYNPSTVAIQSEKQNPSPLPAKKHDLLAPLSNPKHSSPQTRKRRIGNNLMGARFDKLPLMKNKRYSHMGVYFKTGKLKYVYIFGGRTHGDITINNCEKYSFQEKKWIQIAPLSLPRSTGFAIVVNQKIYVFGGYCAEGKRSKKIERYNPIYDSWETLNFKLHRGIQTGLLLPIPKSNNEILLVGGNVEAGGLKSVVRLNFQYQNYVWESDLKKQRLLQKGIFLPEQNSAYIFGGDFQDTVEKYSYKDKSWKIMNNLSYSECISPDDINNFTMAQQTIELEFNDQNQAKNQQNMTSQYKYIFGSDDYPCIFEINTTKWVAKKKSVPMSLRLRSQMTVGKIKQGKYFVGGGIDSYDEKSSKCAYIYYSKTNKAIEISKMNEKKHGFALCVSNPQQIYIFGGRSKINIQDTILQTCEKYDINEDKWTKLPNMPRQRSNCRAILTNKADHILLIGGIDSSYQSVNEIDIFNIKTQEWKTLKQIVPVPLDIRNIGIIQNSLSNQIPEQKLLNKNKDAFQFLDDQNKQQKQQQQQQQTGRQKIEQKQQQNNVNKNQQQTIKLLIFNYNSYLKTYNTILLKINLTTEQIMEIPLNNNKVFAHNLSFTARISENKVQENGMGYNMEESMEKKVKDDNIIDKETFHYFISSKGIFKWKFNPEKQQNSNPQIVINQIHLLSMPLDKFCVA